LFSDPLLYRADAASTNPVMSLAAKPPAASSPLPGSHEPGFRSL
jgi:hypothetical protein